MTLPFELKTEDELLIYLAQTSIDSETENNIRILIGKGLNWDHLLNIISYHGLTPLVYSNLKNYLDTVPDDVLNLFKDYYYRNTQKNLLFMAEMLKLLELFKTNNIIAIPYKGPIMAVYGYGDLSLREFGDLDIFIDKKDFSMVKEILIQDNYETVLKLNSSKESEYMKSQREYKFKNIKNGVSLEIQWNVVGFSFSFPEESSFPLNQSEFKSTSINNQSLKIFSDEDLILILCLHVAGHLWSRLLWVCDIVELIKSKELEWIKIMDKARYLGMERILFLNLLISHTLFNLKLPQIVQDEIKKDPDVKILEIQILSLIFTPDDFSFMHKVRLRFKMRESKFNGFKDILKILTIPQSDEWSSFEKNYPVSLLYVLNRPKQIINRLK